MQAIIIRTVALLATVFGAASTVLAGPRASANYSIVAESIGGAGSRAQSTSYSMKGSAVGEFGAGANPIVTSAAYSAKAGFVGELYDIVALSVTAPPSNNLNEAATRQLVAAPLADDATTLAPLNPSTVTWSVVSGPIASITSAGVATAGTVYQNTPATVGGSAQSLSGQLSLTVLNVNTDDFGAYAGDQIDDGWQVQYFGQPPNSNAGPNADPDGDGQRNLFEFVAGLVPTDTLSRFALRIEGVAGQPNQKNLIFNPVVAGRTYTVQFTTLLSPPSWGTLTGTTQSDLGSERTVTDLNATGATKFYRVHIAKP